MRRLPALNLIRTFIVFLSVFFFFYSTVHARAACQKTQTQVIQEQPELQLSGHLKTCGKNHNAVSYSVLEIQSTCSDCTVTFDEIRIDKKGKKSIWYFSSQSETLARPLGTLKQGSLTQEEKLQFKKRYFLNPKLCQKGSLDKCLSLPGQIFSVDSHHLAPVPSLGEVNHREKIQCSISGKVARLSCRDQDGVLLGHGVER